MNIAKNKTSNNNQQSMECIQFIDGDEYTDDDVMSSSNKSVDEVINDALLQKLRAFALKPQENSDTIKSISLKIMTCVTSSDRYTRERALEKLWRKNFSNAETFIKLLETCKDHVTVSYVVGILHECISSRCPKAKIRGNKHKSIIKNNSKIALTQLINAGGTQVFINLLVNLQYTDYMMADAIVQDVLWVLGQMAQKDQKFAMKVKLLNSTKLFHYLLKQYYNHDKPLQSLLIIIKNLANNSSSVQALVKDGIVATLEKTFVYLGHTPRLKLKILFECFKQFTVSRLCCTKFVKVGLVQLLMQMFEKWEKFDGQLTLKIYNYTLNILQHLCHIRSGKKTIKSNGGLQLLYKFCTNCPEDKSYDRLLFRVCGIINQCLEKKELPVPEMSPARFVLPEVTGKIRKEDAESGSEADSQVHSMSSTGEEDSCDDDESEDLRKLKENRSNSNDNPDENILFSSVISSQRSKKDLIEYSLFFKEFGNLYSQLSLTWRMTEQSNDQVMNYWEEERKMHEAKFNESKVMSNETKLIGNNVNINKNYETDLKRVSAIPTNVSNEHAYCALASMVKSVINFVKVAYPDLIGGHSLDKLEPLNVKDRKVCRSKLLACADRALRLDNLMQETVYDLDALTMNSVTNGKIKTNDQLLRNWDLKRIGKHTNDSKQLHFESRFESGNLRKAIQIAEKEYDLILTPDVNSGSRHQWFYFEVSNMDGNVPYTFNIINCEKTNSQFNFGMKPLLFSVTEAQLGNVGWVRTGFDICYYRNYYQRSSKEKNYLTTSFTVIFPHSHDVCYLAYHFPYTYTQLLMNIWKWSKKQTLEDIYFKVDTLCNTLNGNENPLITITSPDSKGNLIKNRKIIFLTSRVHPGESNASWMMHGTLETLLGSSTYARSLRDDYVFKVIPMLNIEGVINGCNRCGLTNEDLNRRWSNPNQVLHPVIYHTKGLMEYCTKVLQKPPHVFVDYHGHSRRKNVFLFGCSTSGSWSAADKSKVDKPITYLMLPHLMQKISPAFALPLCSFKVERNKESTARVAIWRQLGVCRSYTMESSFCGCDQGTLAGYHFDIKHLRTVGQDFCKALSMMEDGVEEWSIDKLPVYELRNHFMHDSRLRVELCCPLKCILQKSKRSSKCIQDKHEKHHFVGLP